MDKQNIKYDPNLVNPSDVLEFNVVPNRKNKQHPTQKPLELLEWLVKTYSNEDDIVLDNCMGVGTCGVACRNTNRSFVGIEKDTKYFNIAVNNIKEIPILSWLLLLDMIRYKCSQVRTTFNTVVAE